MLVNIVFCIISVLLVLNNFIDRRSLNIAARLIVFWDTEYVGEYWIL